MNKLNIILTGASHGLGREIYKSLKREYNVFGTYKEHFVEGFYYLDITDNNSIENFANEIFQQTKRIDVVINNAGINRDALIENMSIPDFEQVINVNLIGTFKVIKKFIPFMIETNFGRIVNISSVVALTGNIGQVNYSASKAGIIGLSKSLALELAKYSITVNTICPGFIDIGISKMIPDPIKQKIEKKIPLKRFGKPIDIVKAIQFIIDSEYITGSVININGGLY